MSSRGCLIVFSFTIGMQARSSLKDSESSANSMVGVDRMQRNFEPMREQVEGWQRSELTDVTAKVMIYEAFVEGKLEAPKHLARTAHNLYFEPRYDKFRPRTIWCYPLQRT